MATLEKQIAINTTRHEKNFQRYMFSGENVLLCGSQFIDNIDNWQEEFQKYRDEIPESMGKKSHNIKSRSTAKNNTLSYQQVLSFLPEECDFHGGMMTPEMCAQFALEYLQTRYPEQAYVYAIHKEPMKDNHGKLIKSDTGEQLYRNYSVHLLINRTNHKTGNRLHEGEGKAAGQKRAAFVRDLDKKWKLEHLKEGESNSQIAKRKPTRQEKEITARGKAQNKGDWESYKATLREMVGKARDRAIDFDHFANQLEEWRIEALKRNGRIYVRDKDNPRYQFNTAKLDASYTPNILNKAFQENAKLRAIETLLRGFEDKAKIATATRKEIKVKRSEYKTLLDNKYREYVHIATIAKGTPLKHFEKFKLPRLPDLLRDDFESKQLLLSYKIKGEKLRDKYASNHPVVKKDTQLQGSDNTVGDITQQKVMSRDIGITSR